MPRKKAKKREVLDIFYKKEWDLEKEFPDLKGWEAIGFHRSIAKELWEFFFEMLFGMVWIYTVGILTPLLYPYPEILGYSGIAGALFATVYLAFDIGTNFPFTRYVAEYRIKNPNKMLEYIRFFIWYQMLTGLVQVTALSAFILFIINTGEYAYLSWLLLLVLQKQWPGMLGIFSMVLEGNQQYAKTTALSWAQGFLLEYPLKIGMILLGRWYGAQHPEIGILMGMALGSVLGVYLDDIIFMFIAGFLFAKTLKPFGFTFRDAWRLKVGKDVLQTAFKYGIQSTIVPLIGSAITTLILTWYLNQIPGIITWRALIAIGAGFTGMMWNIGVPLGTPIAESYSNGKKKLAEFYVSYYVKWKYFFLILIGSIVAALLPFYELTLDQYSGLKYYQLATVFVLPTLVTNLIYPILNLPGDILYGAEKITQNNIFTLIHYGLNLFFIWLWLFVFEIQRFGLPGIIFLLCFENVVPNVIMSLLRGFYVRKKVIQIKIYWMSSIIMPTVSALPIFALASFWINRVFPWLIIAVGYEIAMMLSFLISVTVILFGIFFPLTGILGVWDDYMLHTFEMAVKLSGPSKFIFKPALKMINLGVNIGKKLGLHGRWGIPWEKAHQEIRELSIIRSQQIKDVKAAE